MPFHISLIACEYRTAELARVREQLSVLTMGVWTSPGVVAVACLVDVGKCGLLTTWQDHDSFVAWRQKISHRRLRDFIARLSDNRQHSFDCAFHETDMASPADRPAEAKGVGRGSIVPLRRPSG